MSDDEQSAKPSWWECATCEVLWFDVPSEGCWVCGQPGQPGRRPSVTSCNMEWNPPTYPPPKTEPAIEDVA